jgi:hypothetical protein
MARGGAEHRLLAAEGAVQPAEAGGGEDDRCGGRDLDVAEGGHPPRRGQGHGPRKRLERRGAQALGDLDHVGGELAALGAAVEVRPHQRALELRQLAVELQRRPLAGAVTEHGACSRVPHLFV